MRYFILRVVILFVALSCGTELFGMLRDPRNRINRSLTDGDSDSGDDNDISPRSDLRSREGAQSAEKKKEIDHLKQLVARGGLEKLIISRIENNNQGCENGSENEKEFEGRVARRGVRRLFKQNERLGKA